ncbi:adenine deaminase [mine drainage metagenome]|uniref:adenine deaminase n=1 Tax=mine drainage metagenome TaxID=410659 RepID=A0A1J5SW62_9ZZZZ
MGNLVDVWKKEIYPAEIIVENGKIRSIIPINKSANKQINYILPGFVDSHVHVESSMLVPSEFAKLAVVHGSVGSVNDPHEIANVCGLEGVEFMIENGKQVNFKFNFGAPSCVPATVFETAGAALNSDAVKKLLEKKEIKYLSEMMNFPGVLFADDEVMKKIKYAHELNKPVDGHAPGLRGDDAKKYIEAGISTDHECFTADEALDKLKYGMKILIREGSAAKNFEALINLLPEHFENMMFCSDDKHPDSLAVGHINQLCARAVAKGIDIFKVLQPACVNPVLHYKLDIGLLRVGDDADFIVAEDLINFNIKKTFINGELVAENGTSFIKSVPVNSINNFNCDEIEIEKMQFSLKRWGNAEEENIEQVNVIEALEGQLITNKLIYSITDFNVENENIFSNTEKDLLKMVVVNRYFNAPIAKTFIKNFGLKEGAIASSVAHDSHNIVAVGVDDASLARAINLVIQQKGGVSAVSINNEKVLGLPVAGLMSADDGYKVADAYTAIDKMVKQELKSTLAAPFMTLSFMALLVIPHLKLSDMGLFDGDKFEFVK